MKRIKKLTESDIKRIVRKSLHRLFEGDERRYAQIKQQVADAFPAFDEAIRLLYELPDEEAQTLVADFEELLEALDDYLSR